MQFTVRALSEDLQLRQLQVEALDADEAARVVRAQGLFVASVDRAALALGSRGPALDLLSFSQELLALLQAGLGIVEAIEALHEKERRPLVRQLYERMLQSLREGRRLSAALAEHPAVFPPLYLGVLGAAEGTSDLPQSLERYIAYRQRMDALRAKVVGAAIYPAILLVVGSAVSLFLVGYVVPRFAAVYEGAGRQLPWMSAVLLQAGRWMSAHWLLMLGGLVALVSAVVWSWRSGTLQSAAGALAARLPGLGERIRMYQLSRTYLTLGMLLEGGIAVLPALHTAAQAGGPGVAPRLREAALLVSQGLPLSEAFDRFGLATGISLRLLLVGERTGQLGTMLGRSAAFFDGEIARWLDRFMRSFEPLLMAGIGLVVGVLVLLLYMPIFDLAGSF